MKKCGKCHAFKDESEFYKSNHNKSGLEPKCKKCKHDYIVNHYINNKEQINAHNKQYHKEHRSEINEYLKEYRQKRRQEDPLFKFIDNTRCLMSQSFKNGGWTKNSTTQELLGCSFEEFLSYLGPSPSEDCEKDHICPLAQAKTQEEVEKLWHYSNFRWLSSAENGSKSDKWTKEGEELCKKLLGREWIY